MKKIFAFPLLALSLVACTGGYSGTGSDKIPFNDVTVEKVEAGYNRTTIVVKDKKGKESNLFATNEAASRFITELETARDNKERINIETQGSRKIDEGYFVYLEKITGSSQQTKKPKGPFPREI